MAKKIAEICAAEKVDFIFKASYDKANRTSVRSFRGIGVRDGCEILSCIGRELKIPVTTDVHSPEEAEIAGKKIDMLQIPAFLCRQTDLLLAAAETGRAINVKKGQFLAPWDVRNIAEKLVAFGNERFCFSGDSVLAPVLARAAMAAGCDGIFMEVHENPARALSDGPSQIPLKNLPKYLRMLKAIHVAVS